MDLISKFLIIAPNVQGVYNDAGDFRQLLAIHGSVPQLVNVDKGVRRLAGDADDEGMGWKPGDHVAPKIEEASEGMDFKPGDSTKAPPDVNVEAEGMDFKMGDTTTAPPEPQDSGMDFKPGDVMSTPVPRLEGAEDAADAEGGGDAAGEPEAPTEGFRRLNAGGGDDEVDGDADDVDGPAEPDEVVLSDDDHLLKLKLEIGDKVNPADVIRKWKEAHGGSADQAAPASAVEKWTAEAVSAEDDPVSAEQAEPNQAKPLSRIEKSRANHGGSAEQAEPNQVASQKSHPKPSRIQKKKPSRIQKSKANHGGSAEQAVSAD